MDFKFGRDNNDFSWPVIVISVIIFSYLGPALGADGNVDC